jgi:thiamine-phosphate pyrophosphorylase
MGAHPILCLVTDRGTAPAGRLVEVVAACVAGGVDWVQVRERGLEGGALLELAEAIALAARRAALRRGGAVRVVINRRIDVALALGADGVHLGFDALDVERARALLGGDRLIGVSAHAPDEALAAARAGASYVQLAPVWAPLSKPVSRPPLGLAAVEAAAAAEAPLLAQGGMDAATVGAALAAGAAGVAVTGALLGAADPEGAARRLRAVLDRRAAPASITGGRA